MHHSLIKASPHSINLTLCLCLCRHHNYLSFNGSLSGVYVCLSQTVRYISHVCTCVCIYERASGVAHSDPCAVCEARACIEPPRCAARCDDSVSFACIISQACRPSKGRQLSDTPVETMPPRRVSRASAALAILVALCIASASVLSVDAQITWFTAVAGGAQGSQVCASSQGVVQVGLSSSTVSLARVGQASAAVEFGYVALMDADLGAPLSLFTIGSGFYSGCAAVASITCATDSSGVCIPRRHTTATTTTESIKVLSDSCVVVRVRASFRDSM